MKWFRSLLVVALVILGLAFPSSAMADDLDVAVTVTAVPNTLTVPSSVDYTVTVAVVGGEVADYVGVQITFPNSSFLSSVSGACNIVNRVANCVVSTGLVAGSPVQWGFQGQVTLLAVGAFTTTATLTTVQASDANSANNTSTAQCTAVTSVLVTCP